MGCGRVAPNHAWAARQAGARLVWACDHHRDRAESLAERWGIERVTGFVDDLVADDELDVVSVATGHASHLPVALRLAGKRAVLIEKPLGLPNDDVAAFQKSVESTPASIWVSAQHRFDVPLRWARWVLEAGDLGKIHLVRARTTCFREDEYYLDSDWRGTWGSEGGSALINQGYHGLDALHYLLGRPRVISSRITNGRKAVMETDNAYHAHLMFDDGIAGEVEGSNSDPGEWDVVVEIEGSEDRMVLDLNHPPSIRVGPQPPDTGAPQAEPPPGLDYYGMSHGPLMAVVMDHVRQGKRTTQSLEQAAETLQTIRSVYRAAGVTL